MLLYPKCVDSLHTNSPNTCICSRKSSFLYRQTAHILAAILYRNSLFLLLLFYIPHRIYFILFCFSCQDFLMILFRARKLNFTLDLSNFPPKTFISFYIQFSRYAFYLPPLPFPTYLHSKKMSNRKQVLSFRTFLFDIIEQIA